MYTVCIAQNPEYSKYFCICFKTVTELGFYAEIQNFLHNMEYQPDDLYWSFCSDTQEGCQYDVAVYSIKTVHSFQL